MKTIFILFIAALSAPTFACRNSVPKSEAIKAIALEPNAGSKSCSDLPKEPCLCFDGIDWETAKIAAGDAGEDILAVDKDKVTAKIARLEAEATAIEAERLAREQDLAAIDSINPDIDLDTPTTIAGLKVKLKEMRDNQKALLKAIKALK